MLLRRLRSCVFSAPLVAHAQVANTIAFYDFNNGTLDDDSGNGNNGIPGVTPPTATPSGFQGGGMQFTATDDGGFGNYFQAPVNLSPSVNPELTFGGWFYESGPITLETGLITNDTGGYCPAIDIDGRDSGNTPTWSAFAGPGSTGGTTGVLSSGVDVISDVWTFVAAVYDQADTTVTLYVDDGSGLVTKTSTDYYPSVGQTGSLDAAVGRNLNFDNPFNGDMDNVFFVGSALTTPEIQTIESEGQTAFIPSRGAAAPEPGSFALGLTGVLSVTGFAVRRRRRATAPA